MNIKKSTFPQWILLPILFSSASVLAGGLGYAPTSVTDQAAALSADSDGFLDDVQETNNAAMNYVGGNTRIGVGFDTDFKGRIDGSHIFSHSNDSATSGSGWIGINPQADDDKDEDNNNAENDDDDHDKSEGVTGTDTVIRINHKTHEN